MARASTPTLLSLDDYARVMGLNPAHFNTGLNDDAMPGSTTCDDVWFQWSWQTGNDRVGREELAEAIANAEQDIANVLGYWPAPKWIAQEHHAYPRHHRPDLIRSGGYDVRGYHVSVNADYGYVISPGRRAVTLVGTAATIAGTLAYSDADGDGVIDTATVAIATALTDECEVKVYFHGHGGDLEWEIRPARTRAIAGGTFTATFWPWQFIDPDLWEALPTGAGEAAIDWNEATVPGTYDNLVDSVDVYREYTDTTTASATFYWEPKTQPLDWAASLACGCGGSGCAACGLTTQDGCLHIRKPVEGVVVPEPATYSDGAWSAASWAVCRDPDFVKLWYCAGYLDERWRGGASCEPLSRWWQETIAWLATARVERPFCSCENVADYVESLRVDMALAGGTQSYNVTLEDLANPFGTRRGAVLAWKRVSKLARKRGRVAVA